MIKNILALQIPSIVGSTEQNFKNLKLFLDEILQDKNVKPDFLFLPEVWSVGWYPSCFRENYDDGPIIEFLSLLAKKYNFNIFGGSYIRKTEDSFKNSCPVILRNGSLLGHYDKIHLYSPDGEAKALKRGNTAYIFEIEGLRTGVSLCYDIRFPELFRSYINVQNPPHFLVNMAAWPMTRKEQYQLMAASRAIENQAYFLALSQCGEIRDGVFNSGFSSACDPMGECIEKLDESRGFIYFALDTAAVDKVRSTYPNLDNKLVDNFGFSAEELIANGAFKC